MLLNIRKKFLNLRFRYIRNIRGSISIEFAMLLSPFLAMIFAQIAIGLYFFTTFSLENAVEEASRVIRTGQAQTAQMLKSKFKEEVCLRSPRFIDCENHLSVKIMEFNSLEAINIPSCLDDKGDLITDTKMDDPVPGAPNTIVLVIACHEWTLAGVIPYLKLGNMENGSSLIQAATTFRTELY